MVDIDYVKKTGRTLAILAAVAGTLSLTAAPSVAYARDWHGDGGYWNGGHRSGGWYGGGHRGGWGGYYYSYPYRYSYPYQYAYRYPYYGGGYGGYPYSYGY